MDMWTLQMCISRPLEWASKEISCQISMQRVVNGHFLVVSGVALDLWKPKRPLMFECKRYGLSFSINRLVRENLQLVPSSEWLGMKCERHLEVITGRRGLVRRLLCDDADNLECRDQIDDHIPGWISERPIHRVANDLCGSPGKYECRQRLQNPRYL